MKKRLFFMPILFFAYCLCMAQSKFVINGNTREIGNGYYHTSGGIFNTGANFTYQSDRPLDVEIYARLDSLDLVFNPFNNQSLIYKVNNNRQVKLNDWFIEMVELAQMISMITEGLYDITASPLINLWGFGFKNMGEITQSKIDSVKQFIGFDKIMLLNDKIIKSDPRVEINASSIAKGYSVDKIAELLEENGVKNYLVEIGGEIRLSGHDMQGFDWRINIPKPSDKVAGIPDELVASLGMTYGSVASSGNMSNYYVKDGKKTAHIINPLTGYPAESDILMATVIYPECSIADGFATAFMAMGLEKAIEIAEKVRGMRYIFLTENENGEIQIFRN